VLHYEYHEYVQLPVEEHPKVVKFLSCHIFILHIGNLGMGHEIEFKYLDKKIISSSNKEEPLLVFDFLKCSSVEMVHPQNVRLQNVKFQT
jgi:hypothetical protein